MNFRVGDDVRVLATFDNKLYDGRISNISETGIITVSTQFGSVRTTDQNRIKSA